MKRSVSLFAAAAVAASVFAGAAQAKDADKVIRLTIGEPRMTVDGAAVNIDDEGTVPVIVNERTLVPIRAIIEAAGGAVGWDGATQTVTLSYAGSNIELKIDSATARLNGMTDELDTAPAIINERTMLPIRYISECFGFHVDWDGDAQTVTLTVHPAIIEVGDIKVTEDDVFGFYEEVTDNSISYATELLKYGQLAAMKGVTLDEETEDTIAHIISDQAWDMVEADVSRGTVHRMLQAIGLSQMLAAKVAEGINVSETQQKEHFISSYMRAKHILVEDKTLAEDILKKAQGGVDFDKLIADYNTDPGMPSNPDGYIFTDGEMVEPFENCVKSLKPDEIGICESDYGWHIIKRLSLTGDEEGFSGWLEAEKEKVEDDIIYDNINDELERMCAEAGIEAKTVK